MAKLSPNASLKARSKGNINYKVSENIVQTLNMTISDDIYNHSWLNIGLSNN